MKIVVSVTPEVLDHPGDVTPSHFEACDACRSRLMEAIEDAIVAAVNMSDAEPLVPYKAFVGRINKYELVGNNIHLRKRNVTVSNGEHRNADLLPRDWAGSDER